MTETRPDGDTGGSGGAARQTPGRWYVVLPALAFLLGLVLGGVLVWVGRDGSGTAAEPAATASGAPSPSATDDTTVTVPAECVAVADTVDRTVEVLRRAVSAVGDLQGGEVVDLLNQLEDLDTEVRMQADACRDLRVEGGTAEPSPTSDAG